MRVVEITCDGCGAKIERVHTYNDGMVEVQSNTGVFVHDVLDIHSTARTMSRPQKRYELCEPCADEVLAAVQGRLEELRS